MNKNINIISQLYTEASKSVIEQQMAAAIMQSNKLLSKPYCNSPFNIIKGCNVGSLHAEAHAILKYFGKSFYFDPYKNIVYNDKKRKKLDLIVIRINKNGDLCNARPCYICLNMMKCAGIHKVYYSISSTELICENIKDMVSIQTSSVTRSIDLGYKEIKYRNPIMYYETLIIKFFPSHIKLNNLKYFIKYNLNILLPSYTVIFYNKGLKNYVAINNENDIKIVEAEII